MVQLANPSVSTTALFQGLVTDAKPRRVLELSLYMRPILLPETKALLFNRQI